MSLCLEGAYDIVTADTGVLSRCSVQYNRRYPQLAMDTWRQSRLGTPLFMEEVIWELKFES